MKLKSLLGLASASSQTISTFARSANMDASRFRGYLEHDLLPPSPDLDRICATAGISPTLVRISLGRIDRQLAAKLAAHGSEIAALLDAGKTEAPPGLETLSPSFTTQLGNLYQGDCIEVMQTIDSEMADVLFADPPFNLKKMYPSKMDDDLKEGIYLDWTERWLAQCVRVLKPGGALFVWNLPKWNSHIATYLNQSMSFRHWIAVDIKYSLPISGRLYPSHYSLLYYTKGSPKTFHADRLPMEICKHCFGDLRDYGGYKDKMNPKGVNLSDVWFDIPPVRHAKYKRRKDANELSLRLMDRIIEMSSNVGDVVIDPFAGSGTTLAAAELKQRRWIGIELGPLDGVIDRLTNLSDEESYLTRIRKDYNTLFTLHSRRERAKLGLWTCESVRQKITGMAGQTSLEFESMSEPE